MSQKQQKPTLSGQRIRTRKRDEKTKFDPLGFRDALISGLQGTDNDLDKLEKFLDISGSKLDYRQYGEYLFDILFAGGILAPGGSILKEGEKATWSTSVCIFEANEDPETLKGHVQVLNKLICRYRYLQKAFEDETAKILLFLKGFSEDQRKKLAYVIAIILANGMAPATILSSLFQEQMVKEGISLQFVTQVFQTWLSERDLSSLSLALKKAELENKLLLFFPPTKQTPEFFQKHFTANGLEKLNSFQKAQQHASSRKEFTNHLKEMMEEEAPAKELIESCREEMKKSALNEDDVSILIWKVVMRSVEWNKKEDLVAEQALRHLKSYAALIKAFTTQEKSELNLIVKVQEYCYDNMNFMKVFQKIILLFYNTEVLSEDSIMKWYNGGHSAKGKSVFLEQMKKMVEWLQNAEEETESEDEDDE